MVRDKLEQVMAQTLLLVRAKLRWKRSPEKRIVELIAHLAHISQQLENLSSYEDGEIRPMRYLKDHLYDGLFKYDRGAAKYGPYNPDADIRDLVAEAQSELIDARNYLAMHLIKIRTRLQENAQEEDRTPVLIDAADLIQDIENKIAAEEKAA